MSSRIHLLRAVNVGGATLPMAELRALAESLGAANVRTYIASGNLLCDPPGDPAEFDRALERAVEDRFGFFREVISRSRDELVAARAAHPFEVLEPKYSYVTFLTDAPAPENVAAARRFATGDDRWEVVGREMHIRYIGGAGRPQMKDASIGRALGVPGTARNLNSVDKLIELSR
ncbi:MAG: DUF1697 domain-containing protein [Gordonia sp. (in: high G+C Gram-positive bacteria)]|uniref:DUF1697 domain-containing protein n=1 Tax=Gordonia sp. (in: high G+C Gram-positive bacteria) TaxID=84139 RepID=UPI0039E351CB